MKVFDFVVDVKGDGKRLDVVLTESALQLSRRRCRAIIDAGGAYVNKKRVRMASRPVNVGDRIHVEYSEQGLKAAKAAKLGLLGFVEADILRDQDGIIAVNKPPGMPSQATRDQSVLHVVPCLETLFKKAGVTGAGPLVLVHRLDKETSGVLLVARGNAKATALSEQFRERSVKKVYWAICHGIPAQPEFVERSPLSEIDKKTGNVRPVRSGGRSAVTHFKLLATNQELGLCLIECRPETGRSHQIRVHLDMNGLPIVGDKRYGGDKPRRPLPPELAELTQAHHFLHAANLSFSPGVGQPLVKVAAAVPERFARFVALAGIDVTNQKY